MKHFQCFATLFSTVHKKKCINKQSNFVLTITRYGVSLKRGLNKLCDTFYELGYVFRNYCTSGLIEC